jgi:hypothetical protein
MRKTLMLFALAALTTSCFSQSMCSSSQSFVEYCQAGDTSCQGHIIDATHWESGNLFGNWLNFGAEQNILIHFRDAQTGATLSGNVISWDVYLNASQNLATSPNQLVPCAGNACELDPLQDGSATYLKNDTCAPYFVRLVVTFSAAITATDAGAE